MAVGDGSWLKRMFPKLYARKQAKQIEKAKKEHSNVNVALEKKSKDLDDQIKNTKSKVKIRQLTAEKANIDKRRKYDKSSAGDAQMKIDNFVSERTKLRKKLADMKAVDTSGMSTPDKNKHMNDLMATQGRLKDIQKNINELFKVVKKHKMEKIVDKEYRDGAVTPETKLVEDDDEGISYETTY